ncbi:helix-turn-helix domain containing protein [Cupriavidus sp. WKF15]|uniref:TetR/AcrR family transcriptional regulator n=1 Tax=Cupriavidus sp. WKF15 TaxID=3032282 RepID=UPI0023E27074|nr:TetR/AcrR family transcriptional regulator [Cupriavidus sp. WKF15]WER50000.1 helix-turn-helix domain containing protein [Cupriavidus sp. WKF15]
MSPRAYDNTLRKEMEADTIRRIVTATVALHAEKGALATTHAEIAHAAGVSVATVYKHFPSREALLPHCTGMVAEQAPRVDVQALLGLRDSSALMQGLVDMLHGQYAYMDPWMRWMPRDAQMLPALAQIAEAGRSQTGELVRQVLERVAGARVDDRTFALAMVILDYPAWQRLTGLLHDPERVSEAAGHALQCVMAGLPRRKERT